MDKYSKSASEEEDLSLREDTKSIVVTSAEQPGSVESASLHATNASSIRAIESATVPSSPILVPPPEDDFQVVAEVARSDLNTAPLFWFSVCMSAFLLSGLPALLFMEFYKFLDIGTALNIQSIPLQHLYLIFYFYTITGGLVVLLPMLFVGMIGFIAIKPEFTLRFDKDGVKRISLSKVEALIRKFAFSAREILQLKRWSSDAKSDDFLVPLLGLPPLESISWSRVRHAAFAYSSGIEVLSLSIGDGSNVRSLNIPLADVDLKQRRTLEKTLRRFLPRDRISGRADMFLMRRSSQPWWLPGFFIINTNLDADYQFVKPIKQMRYTDVWFSHLLRPTRKNTSDILAPGTQLQESTVRVLETIGYGGLTNVYLAEKFELKSGEATKIVLKEFILAFDEEDDSSEKQSRIAYDNELTVLQKLHHNNIVKCPEGFIEDHRAYLVLNYIEGSTIQELVYSQGKLPYRQVIELTKQMCQILRYLHSMKVVHRDFTPHNLIIQKNGKLNLIDFNAALHSYRKPDERDDVVGKPDYFSPEQFRGRATAQSDIYSMGATIYFMLTGQEPEPISQSRPKTSNPEVPDGIDEIVARATALNLADRYIDTDMLLADLLVVEQELNLLEESVS